MSVPVCRIRVCNDADICGAGQFVLYWMIACRRTNWNFALQRAVEWATKLQKPLVVFEPLRLGYSWASDRIHRFIIDGMVDNAHRLAPCQPRGIVYFPYIEPLPKAGKGLFSALAARACIIVTDDYPCFFLPRMVNKAAQTALVRMEQVDSNGLLPMRATDQVFTTAHAFRRCLHRELPAHLIDFPVPDPLSNVSLLPLPRFPAKISRHWPPASIGMLTRDADVCKVLGIDHSVTVVEERGGAVAAQGRLQSFLNEKLTGYSGRGNHPDEDVRSGLSPYLHFGHISAHEIFRELARKEDWHFEAWETKPTGQRHGWWGMSESAEAFLDELITWRELGFNLCSKSDSYDRYESLPTWSQTTLAKHAADPRSFVYSLEEFETARTHDPLWNAAQSQLRREGRIHNYLRMLWGKKILEWTANPRDALAVMIELNNKYALDGRDPNSYSGIFWVLGRYDRPWGPELPIFGTVRYMSSTSTARKLRVREYLKRFSNPDR